MRGGRRREQAGRDARVPARRRRRLSTRGGGVGGGGQLRAFVRFCSLPGSGRERATRYARVPRARFHASRRCLRDSRDKVMLADDGRSSTGNTPGLNMHGVGMVAFGELQRKREKKEKKERKKNRSTETTDWRVVSNRSDNLRSVSTLTPTDYVTDIPTHTHN